MNDTSDRSWTEEISFGDEEFGDDTLVSIRLHQVLILCFTFYHVHVVLMIIQQLPSEDFGLHVWPSALFLSDYIWAHRKSLEGELVVELGSGIGLPGEKSLACDF
jgi:hypothetical protein